MSPPTSRARPAAFLLPLLAVLVALVCLAVPPASAAVITEGCVCSDVRPRVGTGATHVERFAVAKSCADIKAAGQCQEQWLMDTVKELEGDGYCMLTCGRCTCCQPVATALKKNGLTAILDAAKGTPYEEAWNDPAWHGVVLAPRSGPIASDVSMHILPPVAQWGNATWTADLLAAEEQVMTAAGKAVDVRTAGGNTQIGRARLVQGDIQACKGVIHVVDAAVV